MRISEVAERTGLNISNVRFYERKGLLTPDRETGNKYRDYSEEDVNRIKKILLYRKIGISIDTIYLILNDKQDIKDIILRQQKELNEEILGLTGALKLCETMLSQDIDNLSTEQIDRYLEYVYEEEKKGTRFFEVTELLEDITDYTKAKLPHLTFLWITNKPWLPTVFALVFLGMVAAVPIAHLIDVINGKDTFSILKLSVFAVILIIYGYGFFKFRRLRKGNVA